MRASRHAAKHDCLHAGLHACLHSLIPACLHADMPTCIPACLFACMHTTYDPCMHACIREYLPVSLSACRLSASSRSFARPPPVIPTRPHTSPPACLPAPPSPVLPYVRPPVRQSIHLSIMFCILQVGINMAAECIPEEEVRLIRTGSEAYRTTISIYKNHGLTTAGLLTLCTNKTVHLECRIFDH